MEKILLQVRSQVDIPVSGWGHSGSLFEKVGEVKGADKPQRLCNFRYWKICGSEKLRSCFRFFLLDKLTGRNAHPFLEKLSEIADMVTGSLRHLRNRDLFRKVVLDIEDGIGQRRIEIFGSQNDAFRRAAFHVVADEIQNGLFGFQGRKNIFSIAGLDHFLK